MNFQVFKRPWKFSVDEPMISIHKSGHIDFNKAVAVLLAEGGTDLLNVHVELLYDKENRTVGLRWAKPDTPHGYHAVRHQRRGTTRAYWRLASVSFARHWRIKPTHGKRYPATDFGDGIIGFALDY